MNVLLDTHALIWWLMGDENLSAISRRTISEETNIVYVSAATTWEIATKHRIGKLPDMSALVSDFSGVLQDQGFETLDITTRHALLAGNLSIAHKDPFDRMLIAQSIMEDMPLVSNEMAFDAFGVLRVW